MNKLSLTIAAGANAGLCLSFSNQLKVWVDLFPSGETRLFSFLTDEEWEQIKKDPVYFPPDLVLFTHTHPDHYCSRRAKETRALLPAVPIILPRDVPEADASFLPPDAIPISGHEAAFTAPPFYLRMVATQHSGKEYASYRHYSILLTYEDKRIFISGDADYRNEDLTALLEEFRPDLAVLTFPWATTHSGREILEYHVKPAHVLLYHVPNPAEDRNGFRNMALNAVNQLNAADCRVIDHSLQVEHYTL